MKTKKPSSKVPFKCLVDRQQLAEADKNRTQRWQDIMTKLLAIIAAQGGL